MEPISTKTINGHKVEKFYWNGKFVVYVDNKLTDVNFEKLCKELEHCKEANEE